MKTKKELKEFIITLDKKKVVLERERTKMENVLKELKKERKAFSKLLGEYNIETKNEKIKKINYFG